MHFYYGGRACSPTFRRICEEMRRFSLRNIILSRSVTTVSPEEHVLRVVRACIATVAQRATKTFCSQNLNVQKTEVEKSNAHRCTMSGPEEVFSRDLAIASINQVGLKDG